MKESFNQQNIEPKKEVDSGAEKERSNLAKHARRILLATSIAVSALIPNKSEAQKAKEREPKVYTNEKEYKKAKQAYKDSLKLYNKYLNDYSESKSEVKASAKRHNKKFAEKLNKKQSDYENKYGYFKNDPIKPINRHYMSDGGFEGENAFSIDFPVYKKPVQEVIYKPEEKEILPDTKEDKEFFKYYDNKEEYEKALLEYNDSLSSYNNYNLYINAVKDLGFDKYTEKEYLEKALPLDDKYPINWNLGDENSGENHKKVSAPVGKKNDMSGGYENGVWDAYNFKKPLAIPKPREHPPLGTFNIKGKEINYYSEEQKNDILGKLKKNNVIVNRVGDSQNYTVSRFYDGSIEEF